MINLFQPDLTQHPPRSLRVRLGGYAHLPRLLDKARAEIVGKNGDYHYNCPVDERFFAFTGIDPAAMLAAVKDGKTDTEMLTWVNEHCSRLPHEIVAWSTWLEQNGPGGVEGHEWIAGVIKRNAAERTDIRSFADLLDLDDYVSYGGKG
ncbi:MAG: DUF5069 domain-containing protein [Cephaloticoccus sp.]|nr:DUF5069 domain-containing protein [Cephaloticoccus sp.]MCF7759993.1 DUF5069 domain-containing protein [Cephaloticoccus sp.]